MTAVANPNMIDVRDWGYFQSNYNRQPIVATPYDRVDPITVSETCGVRAYWVENQQSVDEAIVVMADVDGGRAVLFNNFAGYALQRHVSHWQAFGNGSVTRGVQRAMQECAELSALSSRNGFTKYTQLGNTITSEALETRLLRRRQLGK